MNIIKVETKNKLFPTGDLWGIFFEDINHAADGGLYPEMIQNRAFEFSKTDNPDYTPLTAWEKRGTGNIYVDDSEPLNASNTHYAVLEPDGSTLTLVNAGFGSGINYERGEKYNYSIYARGTSGSITITFEDSAGNAHHTAVMEITDKWTKYEGAFISDVTDANGKAAVSADAGRACVTMFSVMPDNTFMNHGLRRDLAEKLAALKPKFMRFPGGCLTHDGSFNKNDRNSLYRWVNTVGAVEERPPRRNNWGYNQTAGLGFCEYFLFCEDIGAKAIPVVSGGWNPHSHTGVPIDKIDEFVDETLALIEFANGSAESEWGSLRASMGHEKPFGLEYIAIGNEEVAGGFFERYPYFHEAIRAKYPDIKIIGTSGPWADGYDFDYGWAEAKKHGTDIVDEHYYMHTEWFLKNIDRYNGYDRRGPKVFIGEFASWGNEYHNALAEACYMTAVENNADVVSLACYAPLFANADYINWEPDMIWFNNRQSYATPNYYVQQMFMANQPEYVVKTELESDEKPIAVASADVSGRMGFSLIKTAAEVYDVIIDGAEQTDLYEAGSSKWNADNGRFVFDDASERPTLITFPPLSDGACMTLKAKKLRGREGFRIAFGIKKRTDYYFWEIGGWNNDVSSVSKMKGDKSACITVGAHVTVEEGREYEISVETKGNRFICRLDGEVFHDFTDLGGEIRPLYYTAGVNGNAAVIKAANYRDEAYTTEIKLDKTAERARITELTSEDLHSKNSFEHPLSIAPVEKTVAVDGDSFTYTFPKNSVTVLVIE